MIDGLAPNPDQQIIDAAERAIDEAWIETTLDCLEHERAAIDAVIDEANGLARASFIVLGICAVMMAAILVQALRTSS